MGGYRDDLAAAVARADALQLEVDELRGRTGADGAYIRELEARLALAHRELEELRAVAATVWRPPSRSSRRPALMIASAVVIGTAVAGLASSRAPRPAVRAPAVDVSPPAMPAVAPEPVAPEPEILTGLVTVTSAPSGAVVERDGARLGTTP